MFRPHDSGIRFEECNVWGSGFRGQGSDLTVCGAGFMIEGFSFGGQGSGLRIYLLSYGLTSMV